MRKLMVLLCLLCGAVAMYAGTRVEKLCKELKNPKSKYVLVCAHRGDWRNAPENSLQAYQNCIDMGVDMVEIDIHKTKDGQFIIMHDATLDRTTNGKGKISDFTLDEIKKLYLRTGHHIVTTHKVPTLEEVLYLVKDKILVNIDKGDNYFDEIYELLVKTGTLDQVVIKTNDDYQTMRGKNKNDVFAKSIFMPIVHADKNYDAEKVLADYLTVHPAAFEITFKQESDRLFRILKAVRESGSKLWINSLWESLCAGHNDDRATEKKDPEGSWGWILDQGCSIIQTDRPAALIQYLKKKHRHK